MRSFRFLLFLLLCIGGIITVLGQFDRFPQPQIPFAPKTYLCHRAIEPLVIDGALQEPSWQKCSWTDDFVDIEGPSKPAPRYRTRAKMLWDDDYFYIGAELHDPHVWASLTQRDTIIFYDNDFEVFIDPDGDTHQYYELEINAKNTVWDLLLIKPYRDGGPAVHAWDIAGLKTAVTIQGTLNDPTDVDQGWTVEMALPWQILKECAHKETPPKLGDQWRVNFSRVQWRLQQHEHGYRKEIDPKTGKPYPEDNWVWSPQGLINMHYPEMWGYVQFSGKPAGEEEAFLSTPDEAVKWQLRQIYYAQRNYYILHLDYARALKDLPVTLEKVEGFKWPPLLTANRQFFEARIFSNDGRRSWYIREDGRVLRELYLK